MTLSWSDILYDIIYDIILIWSDILYIRQMSKRFSKYALQL